MLEMAFLMRSDAHVNRQMPPLQGNRVKEWVTKACISESMVVL